MLLWVFRGIFILIISAVLFVNLTSETITREGNAASFWTVAWGGIGIAVFVFLLDLLTPKKKLSALAGVFFGLLVGLHLVQYKSRYYQRRVEKFALVQIRYPPVDNRRRIQDQRSRTLRLLGKLNVRNDKTHVVLRPHHNCDRQKTHTYPQHPFHEKAAKHRKSTPDKLL